MFPANPSPKFSLRACYELARAASAAYQPVDYLEKFAYHLGAREFHFIDNAATDSQCFIVANSTDIVLSFRGTEPTHLRDWITDAEFRKRDWHGARVHRGFANAIDSIWPKIHAQLSTIQDPASGLHNLYLTGHSLGGALAQLCAQRLHDTGTFISGIYTFGQPRVGNARFATNYDAVLRSKTFRLVHEQDIVPRLPGPVLA